MKKTFASFTMSITAVERLPTLCKLLFVSIVTAPLCLQATLIDNGDGTVADPDIGIMWLKQPGPDANWADAVAWAQDLVFAGHNDWRLPSALHFTTGLPDTALNSTANEFGHLYLTELGNPGLGDSIAPLGGYIAGGYWTSTPDGDEAFLFYWSYDYPCEILSTADDSYTSTASILHVTAVRAIQEQEIVVEQPAGNILIDGTASVDWGGGLVGLSRSLTFTIRNAGMPDLNGLSVSITGPQAGDFVVTTAPTTSVPPGGSTTCLVQFTPGAIGLRTATLQILSNDADESPFDVTLVGTGLTPDQFAQQAYLKASNAEADDYFGYSVAVSGDTLVVGAHVEDSAATGVNGNEDDDSARAAGAAYVFVRNGTTWSQQAYLKASNAEAQDYFGDSVAVSGDTVVVGARYEDSAATGVNGNQGDNSASSAGAAYVFVRNGTTWSQQAYLKASNTGANDAFGLSVAVSGDTVVVGAHREDSAATGVNGNQGDNSASDAGAAYVFVRNGATWSQQAYLKASNTGAGDWFGESVTISGDTVVVGARFEGSAATGVDGNQSDNSAGHAGAAYVFVRSGTTWSQQAYLKASNTGSGDEFGCSVAVSGDMVVVGAEWEDSAATGVNGNQSDNSASYSGAAYVFVRSGTTWSQQAYLKASNTEGWDYFGLSVAVSGDMVLVGAHREGSNATGVNGDQDDDSAAYAGAAYVFMRSGTTWSQQAYLKASNTGIGDGFGSSVAVSDNTLALGAVGEGSAANGVNGDQSDNSAYNSGAVYVFNYTMAPGASLSVYPTNLSLTCTEGTDSASQGFDVWNGGWDTMNYTVSESISWLSCAPTSGTITGQHDIITVTCDPDSLAPDTYYGIITVTAPGALGSPQEVAVTLKVEAAAGPIAYWRMEDGPVGGFVTPTAGRTTIEASGTPLSDASGNGNTVYTWDDGSTGHVYTDDVPPSPGSLVPATDQANSLAIRNYGAWPATFTWSAQSSPTGIDVETISPSQWTIEASFKASWADGVYRTFVGREGNGVATENQSAAPLYFQITGGDPANRIRILYVDQAGNIHAATTSNPILAHQWYHVAAVSDGTTLSLYVDQFDGNGYQLAATTDLSWSDNSAMVDPGVDANGDTWGWTLGRGRYGTSDNPNDDHTDRFFGVIDEVRISNQALAPEDFLFAGANMNRGPTLQINRDTGTMTLLNYQTSIDLVGYTITSPSGALDPYYWLPITGNSDVVGDGSFDPDDRWFVVTNATTELSEYEPIGDGGQLGTGGTQTELLLGPAGIWNGNINEDISMAIIVVDESFVEKTNPIPVEFIGTIPPNLTVSSPSLTPICIEGSNAASEQFKVWNSGGETLSYTISDDVGWLSCTPTNGTSAGESNIITVNFSTSGLLPGTYNGTITVTASGASGSPQEVAVKLTVEASEGPLAWWRFEAGPAGTDVVHTDAGGVFSPDVPDSSGNGNHLSMWYTGGEAGYGYRSDVPAGQVSLTGEPNTLAVQNTGAYPCMFTSSNAPIHGITPLAWTIEVAFQPEGTATWRTLVGRDSRGTATLDTNLAVLYLQITPTDQLAIKFCDVSHHFHQAASVPGLVHGFDYPTDPTGTNGQWQAAVATCDGDTLKLYYKNFEAGDGQFSLVAQTDLTLSGSPDRRLTAGAGSGDGWTHGTWTVGRGMYAGYHENRAWGFIDEVRISQGVLTPESFLFPPGLPLELVADPSVGGTITAEPPPVGGGYSNGTVVTLSAHPASGYQFAGWAGDAAVLTNPTTVTMDAPRSVTALFHSPAFNSFDAAASAGSWITWPTWGLQFPIVWDSAVDHSGSPSSGSLGYAVPFTGAAGDQLMSFGTFANRSPWDDGIVLDGTRFARFSFDLKVAPGTAPTINGNYGDFELGLLQGGVAKWELIPLPGFTLPLGNDWVHVVSRIDPAAPGLDAIVGMYIKLWSGGKFTNTFSFNVDNLLLEPIPSPSEYGTAVLGYRPLAYYQLDETNGTTVFDYVGGHDGTCEESAILGAPGPSNPPFLGFDSGNTALQTTSASDSWASAPFGSLATNTVTFTAWIYPLGNQPPWAGILMTRGDGVEGGLGYNDQQMLAYTWNDNTTWNYVSGLLIPTNQWSLVAMVIEPAQATLHLCNADGQLSAVNVLTHTPDTFGNNWTIGADFAASSRTFNGVIDEVAVFAHALTPAQIQQLYTAGMSGPPARLSIEHSGPDLRLLWTSGTLQEAALVAGPYTEVPGAVSPCIVTPTGGAKFYRLKGPNLAQNPGFEAGISGWTPISATLTSSTNLFHGGTHSGLVANRTEAWSGMGKLLAGVLESGHTYRISAWVRLASGPAQPVGLTMKKTDTSGTTYQRVAAGTATSDAWTQLTGTYTLSVSGVLTELFLYVEGPPPGTDLYLDDLVIEP